MHILSDVIRSWVSRFFSNDPKAQCPPDPHRDYADLSRRKELAEERLRRDGFVKNLDGVWIKQDMDDWWTPQNRN
jgi:hypothetical protein